MQFTYATRPGSDKANEDFVGGVGQVAVLLDGAGGPAELANGCVHGTPWYVRNLGLQLLTRLSNEPETPLADLLAQSITHIADMHRDTCDLEHPGSPSSTVAALRSLEAEVDYLVLSDAVVVLDLEEGVQAFTDRRIDQLGASIRKRMRQLPTGSAAHQQQRIQLVEEQRRWRNRTGGHWVAAALPDAAYQAITGSVPKDRLHQAALLSDGAGRYVEFELGSWEMLIQFLNDHGPSALINRVRQAEDSDPLGEHWPRTKRHDDASALLATFG
jgi:hypothetical protein